VADTDTCSRTLDFTVPVEQVEAETSHVLVELQKKARLPGFRPGKVPVSVIRSKFSDSVRQEVLDHLIPRVFTERARQEDLKVVDGTPKVSNVHFHEGEPLRFKIDFEVSPEFDLGEYEGLTAAYQEPQVADRDVDERLEQIRQEHAEYVNIDPKPLEDGDYAAVRLRSRGGLPGKPMESDDTVLHLGAEDTLPEFTEGLRGVEPGESRQITVDYPKEYAHERLAGRKVTFEVTVKAVRRKEVPELNDEFAADVGDFKSLEELRADVRRQLFREREAAAQQKTKGLLVDALVAAHPFPVPKAYVDRQLESSLRDQVRSLAMRGVDPRNLNVDWDELRTTLNPQAERDVKASLLLSKIGERENLFATQEEVDREVHRIAKQMHEPAAAVRMKMEKDGSMGRIANRISTDKVLNFLFERARKVAPEPEAEPESNPESK